MKARGMLCTPAFTRPASFGLPWCGILRVVAITDGSWEGVPRARPRDGVEQLRVLVFAAWDNIVATIKEQPLWRVILDLRVPGTVPGGYPEYPEVLRGGVVFTVAVTLSHCGRNVATGGLANQRDWRKTPNHHSVTNSSFLLDHSRSF